MGLGIAARILGPGRFDEVGIVQSLLPSTGFMVDVGAHHGESHAEPAELGWDVLALEPDPKNRALIPTRPGSKVVVDPRAISKTDGETVTLYSSPISTGITSLAPFHASHSPSAQVETVRLDTLLGEHGNPSVTFLKVDTEGFDLHVLETFPWSQQKPLAVVCEFEDRKTVPLGYTYRELGDLLVRQGYSVFMCEWFPIEEYGTAHRFRRTVEYPATTSEPNAWGNFVGVSPELAKPFARAARRASIQLAGHNKYVSARDLVRRR